jgi:hypothetical protein
MLRCASSLVIAAYDKVRLIPQDSRALPAAFLRSRPIFTIFKTFYRVVNLSRPGANRSRAENVFGSFLQSPYQPRDPRSRSEQPQAPANGAQSLKLKYKQYFW